METEPTYRCGCTIHEYRDYKIVEQGEPDNDYCVTVETPSGGEWAFNTVDDAKRFIDAPDDVRHVIDDNEEHRLHIRQLI